MGGGACCFASANACAFTPSNASTFATCDCECVHLCGCEWRVFLDCERVYFCGLRLRMRALLRLAAANGVRFCDYECVRFYAFGCGRFCDCERVLSNFVVEGRETYLLRLTSRQAQGANLRRRDREAFRRYLMRFPRGASICRVRRAKRTAFGRQRGALAFERIRRSDSPASRIGRVRGCAVQAH